MSSEELKVVEFGCGKSCLFRGDPLEIEEALQEAAPSTALCVNSLPSPSPPSLMRDH